MAGNIKVRCEIKIYELNGEEIEAGKTLKMNIVSHWNRSNLVTIEIGGNKYTVSGHNVIAAVENSMNIC